MEVAEVFRALSPIVQLALIIGGFATIFLLARNRAAGTNLIAFLRDFLMLYEQRDRHDRRSTFRQSLVGPALRKRLGSRKVDNSGTVMKSVNSL